MEHPPGSSLDDTQSQDLPKTSSIPTVLNLAKRSEEVTLKDSSPEAGRMVKSPSWYSHTVSSGSLPLSETASTDHRLQMGHHIQPDNAFSNTTVTLSYVSRSNVFTAQDTLSQHSPRYGIPPISKFSLHNASHGSEKGLQDTDRAHFCLERNAHYLDQVDRPSDLTSHTQLFESFSQAHVEGDICQTKEPHALNGGFVCSDGCGIKHKAQHMGNNTNGFQNGQDDLWLSHAVDPLCPQIACSRDEESPGGDTGVLFLISKTEEPVISTDSMSSSDLCLLNKEYISTLVDPMSPSTTCLEEVEDALIFPQPLDSPGMNDSRVGEASDADREADKPALSSPQRTGSSGTLGLYVSNRPHRRKDILEPIIDLTEDLPFLSGVLGNESKKTTPTHLNGNTTVVQEALETKKLPARSGRGTRLEAIVMNIHPGRYRASRSVSPSKKANAYPSSTNRSEAVCSKEDTSPIELLNNINKDNSVKNAKPREFNPPVKCNKDNVVDRNCCIDTTLGSKLGSYSKTQDATPMKPEVRSPVHLRPEPFSTPPNQFSPKANVVSVSSPQKCVVEVSSPLSASSDLSSPQKTAKMFSPPPKDSGNVLLQAILDEDLSTTPVVFQKDSPIKPQTSTARSKAPPAANTKAASAPKRKRKTYRPSQPSIFAPPEPEIKLKYVNHKEERREQRADTFSPFVRVQLKPPSLSLCTVVNDPEDEQPQLKKGQASHGGSGSFIPGAIPSTSCLQLGRLSSRSPYHSSLVCCLCGKSANALDLGDLHGPYYPEGNRPGGSIPSLHDNNNDEDEERYSDSDSSCNMKGRGGKSARLPGMWHHQQALLRKHCWQVGEPEPGGDLAAKRPRTEAGEGASEAAVQDWYSAPTVPLQPCEYWLHEDCGIWSADVFLVKGKVYGLEEAVKVAQETVCSACHNTGATMCCFFKGCPNNYHFRCALQSDCVLIEENFTMKCKRHRNKSFKSPPVSRRDAR